MLLILSLVGIALVDSLNPSLFIAQFYLFTTPRPGPRVLSYILGVLSSYYVGGLLLLTGIGAVISSAVQQISPEVGALAQVFIGLAALLFGIFYRAQRSAQPADGPKPRSLGLIAAFIFGIVVMGQELTTALPYFVAIERIVEARLSVPEILLALALYNLVLGLPLLAFLGLFLRYRERFTAQLNRISDWTRIWTPRLLKGAAVIFGLALLVNGVVSFVGL